MANPGFNPRFIEGEDLKWTTSKEPSKTLFCILIKHLKAFSLPEHGKPGKQK